MAFAHKHTIHRSSSSFILTIHLSFSHPLSLSHPLSFPSHFPPHHATQARSPTTGVRCERDYAEPSLTLQFVTNGGDRDLDHAAYLFQRATKLHRDKKYEEAARVFNQVRLRC